VRDYTAVRRDGAAQVRQNGRPVDPDAREVVATFRDPAGNLIGIYQQPGLAESEAPSSLALGAG